MTPICQLVRDKIQILVDASLDVSEPDYLEMRSHILECVECRELEHHTKATLEHLVAALSSASELPSMASTRDDTRERAEVIRKRLGLAPSRETILAHLHSMKQSRRLDILRRASKEVGEMFALPNTEVFDGAWRAALMSNRSVTGEADTPSYPIESIDGVIGVALGLNLDAGSGASLGGDNDAESDLIASALLRAIERAADGM